MAPRMVARVVEEGSAQGLGWGLVMGAGLGGQR